MVKNLGDCAVRATPATHRLSDASSSAHTRSSLPGTARRKTRVNALMTRQFSFATAVPRGIPRRSSAGRRITPSEPSERPLSVRLLVLPVADEIVNPWRVGERRGVAEIAVLVFGDLAQNPAHDLSRARLRQTGGELNEIRRGNGADLLAHPGDQLLAQVFARVFA